MVATAASKLIAFDDDDLAIVSAHIHDARVRVADIIWRRADRRLVLGIERIDWENTAESAQEVPRTVSALRFDRVLACRSCNIDRDKLDATFDLLAVEFAETDAPGGTVTLLFAPRTGADKAEPAAIQLDVECLECHLVDLGKVTAA
jgi:hypothetical protein